MVEDQPTRGASPSRRPLILIGVVLAIGLGVVLLRGAMPTTGRSIDGARLVEPTPLAGAEQVAERPQLEITGALDGVLEMAAGDTIHIDHTAIVALGGRALRIEVGLPEPIASEEPRPVRLLVVGGRGIDLEGQLLSASRDRVRVDLPSAVLVEPGRYVVEIETAERRAFPIQRTAIVVR